MNAFTNKGQGLISRNYGDDFSSSDEQLNALEARGAKLAAKVKLMSPNPSVENLISPSMPQQELSDEPIPAVKTTRFDTHGRIRR